METTERNTERARQLFEELGGAVLDGFPTIHSQVHHTEAGTPYLKTPGVVVLARPQTNVAVLGGFLEGFDPELDFAGTSRTLRCSLSSQLCKTAGQVCYGSFGPGARGMKRRRVLRAPDLRRTWFCSGTC